MVSNKWFCSLKRGGWKWQVLAEVLPCLAQALCSLSSGHSQPGALYAFSHTEDTERLQDGVSVMRQRRVGHKYKILMTES